MKTRNIFKRFFISRYFLLLVLLIFELIVLFLPHYILIRNEFFYFTVTIINIIFIIYIINTKKNPYFKLAWIIIIAVTPGVGAFIYLFFADKKIPVNLRTEFVHNFIRARGLISQNPKYTKKLTDTDIKQTFNYVSNNAYYPYYQNSDVKYFKLGEDLFDDLLKEINKAKKFIFLEFFIVKDGYLMGKLLKLLEQKASQGVEVCFMYDDAGSISSEPYRFIERLTSKGIKVAVFSPLSPLLVLTARSNNRDHRKICVVDNKVAYTGGVNVADEYINKVNLYGHWKDTGVKITGEAVKTFTISFIQFFNVYSKHHLIYDNYLIDAPIVKNSSFVLPFSDSPSDIETVGRTVHYQMISRAKKYIYIQTPYLVIDDVMQNALCTASKSGVEVIITVPHIPDKKTVFMVTKSNYYKLLKAGIKIYEYSPGFIHSKLWVVDDKVALEGTVNMDFRSYYLNYEFGVLIANNKEITKMKKDYLDTLKVSQEITMEIVKMTSVFVRIMQAILNVFAPLL